MYDPDEGEGEFAREPYPTAGIILLLILIIAAIVAVNS